jgi:hypothetical protein
MKATETPPVLFRVDWVFDNARIELISPFVQSRRIKMTNNTWGSTMKDLIRVTVKTLVQK